MANIYFLSFYGFSVILLTIYVAYNRFNRGSNRLRMPLGPAGTLFYGVAKQLSSKEPWKQYARWSKYYGVPVISFRVYNRRVIVLNSAEAVHDLLDKRFNIYSDRPKSWMYHELCGRGKSVFNISASDERHKRYKSLLQTGLGIRAIEDYVPLLEQEAQNLVEGFTCFPKDFERHIRRNAATVIMKMAFGYSVQDDRDPFIGIAEQAAQISGWAMAPGQWFVDYFPIVRFIPFTGFKRQAREWSRTLENLSSVPHEWVKSQMDAGGYTESFTSRLMRPNGFTSVDAETEDVIKWCAGGLYAGGTDTIVSALMSFVMLMALYPQYQEKAQQEIDELIGLDRLPRAEDIMQLKYVTAILQEVLRFAPVANLALPHKATQDDVYDGYLIPKDSTVIPNVWAIMHDSSIYPDPFTFNPDRFIFRSKTSCDHINSGVSVKPNPDPRTYAFGFGRRTCPGIHFGTESVLLSMSSILAQFDIRCDGPPPLELQFTSAITSHIKPFPIIIRTRLERI